MVLLTRESRPPPVFILFLKSFIITIKDFFFVIYFERYISGIDLDASLNPYYPFPDKSSKHKNNPSLITIY